MPTPEQQAGYFKIAESPAGMLEDKVTLSNIKEDMFKNIFPESKSVQMTSAYGVLEKLTIVENKIDALSKKIDLIFGECILMPRGGPGHHEFIDLKKLAKGY